MRAAIVANCQARPIADLMRQMFGGMDVHDIVIVHLAKNEERDATYASLDKADVIFSQFVTEQYGVPHVATSRLKHQFGDRVVSFPNIYFRGQCPALAYAATARVPRLIGPLRDYHIFNLYACWKRGDSREECLERLRSADPDYAPIVEATAKQSLDELRGREKFVDVRISDIISEEWRKRSLFLTFNHPTLFLLTQMASRLLAKIGIEATLPEVPGQEEPLGLVLPPILRREVEGVTALQPNETSVGADVGLENGILATRGSRRLDLSELITGFYYSYDKQLDGNDVVKFSPQAGV